MKAQRSSIISTTSTISTLTPGDAFQEVDDVPRGELAEGVTGHEVDTPIVALLVWELRPQPDIREVDARVRWG